ncbi:hypothetical protein ANTRET_LOCUS2391 [Anthophora retusa]
MSLVLENAIQRARILVAKNSANYILIWKRERNRGNKKNLIRVLTRYIIASKGLRTEVGSETRRQSEEKASGVILQENVT